VNRYTDLADFSREQVQELLALARRLETQPEPRSLAGKVLGLLFMNPSLRTLSSFQAGMARLGGNSFVITPGQGTWQFETRDGTVMTGAAAEHIREGLPVLASYCDALGIRSFAAGENLQDDLADQRFNAMAALVDRPLINLESAINHPCQALADWKTLDELPGSGRRKFVLSWVWHPKALPLAVPAATVHMAAMRGMDVVVLRPDGFELPGAIMEKARSAAAQSGGTVTETADRADALTGAHVVYAKEWGSTRHYGNEAADQAQRASLKDWCLRNDWLARAADDCRVMHCLPVRRNSAIADEVLDGPRSIVLRQGYNRMPAQMAVLHQMLSKPRKS
jgi:N-acetylornithine carbamoyltransferase